MSYERKYDRPTPKPNPAAGAPGSRVRSPLLASRDARRRRAPPPLPAIANPDPVSPPNFARFPLLELLPPAEMCGRRVGRVGVTTYVPQFGAEQAQAPRSCLGPLTAAAVGAGRRRRVWQGIQVVVSIRDRAFGKSCVPAARPRGRVWRPWRCAAACRNAFSDARGVRGAEAWAGSPAIGHGPEEKRDFRSRRRTAAAAAAAMAAAVAASSGGGGGGGGGMRCLGGCCGPARRSGAWRHRASARGTFPPSCAFVFGWSWSTATAGRRRMAAALVVGYVRK